MRRTGYWFALLCMLSAFCLPAARIQAEETESFQVLVASGEELTQAKEVGVEGMLPVYGGDVAEGVYEVEVESSSSMFRVERGKLIVHNGAMSAELTLSGTGYEYLYMGKAEQAARAESLEYIPYQEDSEGKYTYTVPVEALDQAIDCAAFGRKRKKWYDREILFLAESLPEGAVLVELPDYQKLRRAAKEKRIEAMRAEGSRRSETEAQTEERRSLEAGEEEKEGSKQKSEESRKSEPNRGWEVREDPEESWEPAETDLADGEYEIRIDFAGGSGRSWVESPAVLIVREGRAYGRIRWSSPYYDYMKAGGNTYFPINKEGDAVFEIPIPAFDKMLSVVGDTRAMSTPHEVEYQLIFYRDSAVLKEAATAFEESKKQPGKAGWLTSGGAAILLFLAFSFIRKTRKGAKKE